MPTVFRRFALAFLVLLYALLPRYALAGDEGTVELNGIVQSMPASGLVGDWSIAGKAVRTDAATSFDQENGPLAVGAIVEAKATPQSDGSLLAQSIEVKQAAGGGSASPGTGTDDGSSDGGGGGTTTSGEIKGAVEALPASGVTGTWTVAGQAVIVVDATRIELDGGTLAVGSLVEVHGTPDASGAFIASSIEVKADAGAANPNPTVEGGKIELLGTIDALPSGGLVGTWTVAGEAIVVDASTALDDENGSFAVGATVEVKALKQTDGTFLAQSIETKSGQGAPVPDAKFWGHVVALPGDGLIGIWKVDDKLVDVTAATEIKLDAGPVAVGAIVEIQGWVQPDGLIAAKEIETTDSIGTMPDQGSVAVEYRNAKLGHFFVTALQSEIAALDAGTAWQRTGETFKVGGPQAVCRFYGMPPRGPDSHFFTASPGECAKVMGDMPAWTFEGQVFSITVPDASGQCPAGMLPVHRLYNQPTSVSDVNHRYTVTAAALSSTLAMGWVDEGVVMCAHP